MKKKTKAKIIFTSILLVLIISHLQDYEYNPDYEILDNGQAYACYRDGNIYIGDEEYLESIDCNPEDVLVCDKRDCSDSNFKIYDSYRITDKESRNDIIEVLLKYEEEHPTDWERTKESMRLEWYIHNISHDLNFALSNTSDVDLDNDDEKVYDSKILRKIFKL